MSSIPLPALRLRHLSTALVVLMAATIGHPAMSAQQDQRVVVEPAALELSIGETAQLNAHVVDATGSAVADAPILFYSLARSAVSVTPDGRLEAHAAGTFQVAALSPREIVPGEPADRTGRYDSGIRTLITVTVAPLPISSLDWSGTPTELPVGASVPLHVVALDSRGAEISTPVEVTSSNPEVLSVGPTGLLRALRAGSATLRGGAELPSDRLVVTIVPNPVSALEMDDMHANVVTGEVVDASATPSGSDGSALTGHPPTYSLESWPDPARPESVGAGAPAMVTEDGKFVAEQPGIYAVTARVGDVRRTRMITVTPRNVGRSVEMLGQAPIRDRVTSDLWVWEASDGRDYAIVGTWNAEGHAYIYDVTDPGNMVRVEEVQVDARTVNDVKVSEDGRVAVISREGASNRRNGLVILDVSDPTDVQILAQYDDQLTGGVHNVFVHDDHVYAVNNGRRVDIINIEDPRSPYRVGRFETDTPGRSVHDVWVHNGVAYEAGRTDGLVVFDVGGGGAGGAPNNPVEMARIPQLTGWNHSAWPFESPSTGKRYVLGGDEAFYSHPMAPESGGINWREKLPSRAKGWIHFVDITDPAEPRETARYQVPESGPHNYWIDEERELLYIGHFDAGLRVVDISGELVGDLYRQGREVAHFFTDDPEGFIPNAPFVWGPQPHKGTIFLADFSSGLWAVRLAPNPFVSTGNTTNAFGFAENRADADADGPTVTPVEVDLAEGESIALDAATSDSTPVLFFSRAPQAVSVTPVGVVTAHRAGEYEIVALAPTASVDADSATASVAGRRTVIVVRVDPAPASELELTNVPTTVVAGSALTVGARFTDGTGRVRDLRPHIVLDQGQYSNRWVPQGAIFEGSSNAHPFYRRERPDTYPYEAAGLLLAEEAGDVMLRATDNAVANRHERALRIVPNRTQQLELTTHATTISTGDVLRVNARALDAAGATVPPAESALRFALRAYPDADRAEGRAAGASAQILRDGRFVAEQPGLYVVEARAGNARDEIAIRVLPRDVQRPIEFIGQGPVRDRVTSDLWVWEGIDGRDYAITGTWQAEGHAYFWDVTDPAAMERIAEIQVDARTVNDVKVSEDGRIAVISREGASNRRNGLVILDVSDPREPDILARYDDQMTGGVHNVFIHDDHVYAINNGRRWDIINIEDPTEPRRVGRFESTIAGRSVQDVWVRDGVAFQAGNTEGIVVVDVGGGNAGGSPANPVEIGRMPQLTGWNHAVWPYRSASTGKFYVIAGDESHPVNPRDPANIISVDNGMASRAMGWLHFIEFDDRDRPVEVARYRVPEAGPHNLWIDWENDILYVAYFNGGLRVVDLSGDLVGDLYRQGREIAKFYSDDLDSFIPNAPMVWGPQPYKGNIFFSDFHSGLWAVRLGEASLPAER